MEVLIRIVCIVILVLGILYFLGTSIEYTREETREKITKAVESCYENNYSILGPSKWEILDCIKNAKLE